MKCDDVLFNINHHVTMSKNPGLDNIKMEGNPASAKVHQSCFSSKT